MTMKAYDRGMRSPFARVLLSVCLCLRILKRIKRTIESVFDYDSRDLAHSHMYLFYHKYKQFTRPLNYKRLNDSSLSLFFYLSKTNERKKLKFGRCVLNTCLCLKLEVS